MSKLILILPFLVAGCASSPMKSFDERNEIEVKLNPAGSKVLVSEVAPLNPKCTFIKQIGNPGIRDINWDKNDFRNRTAELGGNYLHYAGLKSNSGITYTEGFAYKCPQ